MKSPVRHVTTAGACDCGRADYRGVNEAGLASGVQAGSEALNKVCLTLGVIGDLGRTSGMTLAVRLVLLLRLVRGERNIIGWSGKHAFRSKSRVTGKSPVAVCDFKSQSASGTRLIPRIE